MIGRLATAGKVEQVNIDEVTELHGFIVVASDFTTGPDTGLTNFFMHGGVLGPGFSQACLLLQTPISTIIVPLHCAFPDTLHLVRHSCRLRRLGGFILRQSRLNKLDTTVTCDCLTLTSASFTFAYHILNFFLFCSTMQPLLLSLPNHGGTASLP